jgi:hypothetical protein
MFVGVIVVGVIELAGRRWAAARTKASGQIMLGSRK